MIEYTISDLLSDDSSLENSSTTIIGVIQDNLNIVKVKSCGNVACYNERYYYTEACLENGKVLLKVKVIKDDYEMGHYKCEFTTDEKTTTIKKS